MTDLDLTSLYTTIGGVLGTPAAIVTHSLPRLRGCKLGGDQHQQLTLNQRVAGSTPASSTKCRFSQENGTFCFYAVVPGSTMC